MLKQTVHHFDKYLDHVRNSKVIRKTELVFSERLSSQYGCNVFLKREDLQTVRSFKIRGAYCKIIENAQNNNNNQSTKQTVVTASAGNHAQGVALTCASLGIDNTIFVPDKTPKQKINRIQHFALSNDNNDSNNNHKFKLQFSGDNFDECCSAALEYCTENNGIFVHPFDDYDVIMGQSTVCQEIYEDLKDPNIIVNCVGGGGLISGSALYSKHMDPTCHIIGVEPKNANSLQLSMQNKQITSVSNMDTFVDGASVKTMGKLNFEYLCKQHMIDGVYTVSNEEMCCELLDIYEKEGYILEPAGVLAVTALKQISLDYDLKNAGKRKNVVCIMSGGNNDVSRYPEMMEKCLKYKGLKHYFLLNFPQTPGQLKKFVNECLGDGDDITRFEYLKKNHKDYGTVLIGIQISDKNNIHQLMHNMTKTGFQFQKLEENEKLYSYLI